MKRRILIVDDDSHIRYTVRKVLEMRDYEVHEANNGLDALKLLAANFYDVLFLDIIMPEMRGDEVLRRIPAKKKDRMPIVMLTGEDDDRSIMNGYSSGATYYITKPFSGRRIQDIAEYLTGSSDPERKELLELRL